MKNNFSINGSSMPGSAFVDDTRPCGHEPCEKSTIAKMLKRREV